VTDGQLKNSGNSRNTIWGGLYEWQDIVYTAEITPVSGMDIWMIFRVHDKDNLYLFTLGLTGLLWKIENGNFTRLGASNGAVPFLPESTYTMQVILKGDSITVRANDTDLISLTDTTFRNGYAGLGSNGGCRALFDNVSVVCHSTGIGPYNNSLFRPEKEKFYIINSPGQHATTFYFNLTEPDQVSLQVFNLTGNEVITLVSGEYPIGEHRVTWQGRNRDNKTMESGLYYCRITKGGSCLTRQFLLFRE
jgi:hypothetical protein